MFVYRVSCRIRAGSAPYRGGHAADSPQAEWAVIGSPIHIAVIRRWRYMCGLLASVERIVPVEPIVLITRGQGKTPGRGNCPALHYEFCVSDLDAARKTV